MGAYCQRPGPDSCTGCNWTSNGSIAVAYNTVCIVLLCVVAYDVVFVLEKKKIFARDHVWDMVFFQTW